MQSSTFLQPPSLPYLVAAFFFFFSSSVLVGLSLWFGNRKRCQAGVVPRTHPVVGCLVEFYRNKHRILHWYTDLLRESPTNTVVVSRLGSWRTVVTANPDNVEHMLKTNFPNYPKGEPITLLLGDLLGSGIFNADGELWYSQRKLASHEFTTRSLRNTVIDTLESETSSRLVPMLSRACASGMVVDMQDWLRRFAFDSICRISLGTDPGCLEPSLPDSDFAKAFDVAAEICAFRGRALFAAVWKAKRILGIGSEKVLREKVGIIQKSITDLIIRRMEEKHEGRDFLSRLIATGNSLEATRDMVISFVMAGRDTSSAALTWFFWLLSRHPDIHDEVVSEVCRLGVGDEHSSGDHSEAYKRLKEMTFLEACLLETMRLYPPVSWDSKHATANDTFPDGTVVRKGDRVTYSPYAMGRMEDIWGKTWPEFNPRRWITADGKELAKVSPFKFPVFQAGPRVCLGKEMAFVQMKYVASEVLRRFELVPVKEEAPALVPILTSHMAGGLNMVVKERRSPSPLR